MFDVLDKEFSKEVYDLFDKYYNRRKQLENNMDETKEVSTEEPVAVQDIPGVVVDEQPALEGVQTSTLPDPMGQADNVEIMPGSVKIEKLKSVKVKLRGGKDIILSNDQVYNLKQNVNTVKIKKGLDAADNIGTTTVVEETQPVQVEAPVENVVADVTPVETEATVQEVAEATPEVVAEAPVEVSVEQPVVEAAPVEEPTIQPIENTVAGLVGDALNGGVTVQEEPVKRL